MMLPKLAALPLLLLLAAEVSAAEKKLNLLKKLFKKDPKKCDIIWTEKIWPECTVTQEKVCGEVFEDQCTTHTTEECGTTIEEVCHTEHTRQCTTEYKEECETSHTTECSTEHKQVCDSTPHCETVVEEKCSTKYQKICDPGLLEGADLKVVEEQRGEAKKIFSPVFEPSPEKGRKRREVEPEAEVEQGGRRKRHALIKKLFDFIGDKKKKEELCHHVPHKHCVKVPVEECHEVEQCWQEPHENCRQVPHERCWHEPSERCWDEPKVVCHQEPREECRQVPSQQCHQVGREVCQEEPREHCDYLTKLVPMKRCEKPEKFSEKLKKLVGW